MGYFAKLMADNEFSRDFHKLRHQEITPLLLPINMASRLPDACSMIDSWSIKPIETMNYHREHLVLSAANRVNFSHLSSKIDGGINITKVARLFECSPKVSQSPISRLFIGLHEEGQISLMLMAKAGVSQQVCYALSGHHDGDDLKDLALTDVASGAVYNFSQTAGCDLRARATLMVRCDNDDDINRLQSFLAGVNQLTEFDSELLNFCHNVLIKAKDISPYLHQLDEQRVTLRDIEKPSGNRYYWPDEVKNKVARCEEQIKQTLTELSWGIAKPTELNKMTQPFVGLPNLIPDYIKHLQFLYHPKEIKHFPSTLPDIHLAILNNNFDQVKELVDGDPLSLFYRSPYGELAIELALKAGAIEMAAYLFKCWQALPLSEQWCQEQYIDCASDIPHKETQPFIKDVECYQIKVANYFNEKVSPDIDTTAQYLALIERDEEKLLSSVEHQLSVWRDIRHSLLKLEYSAVYANVASLLPDSQQLYADILVGDLTATLVSIQDILSCQFHEMPNQYRFIEQFKRQLIEQMKQDGELEISNIKQQLLEVLQPLVDLYHCLLNKDKEALSGFSHLLRELRVTIANSADYPWQKVIDSVFNQSSVPRYFMVYVALLQSNDIAAAHQTDAIIEKLEHKKSRLLTLLAEFEPPARNIKHHEALSGVMPDMDLLVNEQHHFNAFNQRLDEITLEHVSELYDWFNGLDAATLALKLNELTGWKGAAKEYELKEYLEYLIKHFVVIDEASLKNLDWWIADTTDKLHAAPNDAEQIDVCYELFNSIRKTKLDVIKKIKDCTNAYQSRCAVTNEDHFDVYSTLAGCLSFQRALKKHCPSFSKFSSFYPMMAVLDSKEKALSAHALRAFVALNGGQRTGEKGLVSILRSGLLSFEQQDDWGYTPLLLALVNNQQAYVEAFLVRGLFSQQVVVANEFGDNKNYRLLSHAQTPLTLESLLRYFVEPNQPLPFLKRQQKYYRLLNYGHDLQLDMHRLSLLDRVILNTARVDDAPQTLQLLLGYLDDYVAAGPYDDYVTDEVAAVLTAHNQKIKRKRDKQASRPKAGRPIIDAMKGAKIETDFISERKHYISTIMAMGSLTELQRGQLTTLFCSRFKMRTDDELAKRAAFFKTHILEDSQYYIDVYTDNDQGRIVGFFCFKILTAPSHKTFGDLSVFYASLAVCDESAASSGLLSSSFKMALVAKKMAENNNMPIYFYGRLGRPGIAYLFLPAYAKISTKYALPDELLELIVQQVVGNVMEADGSSMPPVVSMVDRVGYGNWRLAEYDHLLDDVCHAAGDASLPVVAEMDADFSAALLDKMMQSNGIDEQHIEELSTLTDAAFALKR